MRKKSSFVLACLLVLALLTGSTVFAFHDLHGVEGKELILDLKEKGIINGVSKDKFLPQGKLSYAQGVSLIVKGLKLTIDNLRFIKKPEASDYFTKVPNDAWYASSFITAHLNGLTLPKDVNPNQPLTREEFVNYLIQAVNTTGDYPLIELYIMVGDEQQINPEYMGTIQAALITKIATLDEKQKFHPKRPITRAEAAVMLSNAIDFVKKHKEVLPPDKGSQNKQVSFTTKPVTKAVNEVILTWKQAPNPGYSIQVDKIEFQNQKAFIYYSLKQPDPDQFYIQVLTDVKTSTYLDAKYEVEFIENKGLEQSVSFPIAQ